MNFMEPTIRPTATQSMNLAQLKVRGDVLETFECSGKRFAENRGDSEKSKQTLVPRLRLDLNKEKLFDDLNADALLTREYRKPFIVPAEKEI